MTPQQLHELEQSLPVLSCPLANYVSTIQCGNLLYISGQLPLENGNIIQGKVGENLSLEQAHIAAQLCARNILAHVYAALGSLRHVEQCIKITGMINSAPHFTQHPEVLNGASDWLVAALGHQGKHTRVAFGVSSLPRNAAVEIEAIFAVKAQGQ